MENEREKLFHGFDKKYRRYDPMDEII